MHIGLIVSVCLLVVLFDAPAASSTDLGKGNEAIAKTFAAWKKAGPRLKQSDAKRRVMITGFGLFSGVAFNISGVVAESMAHETFWPKAVRLAELKPPARTSVKAGTLASGDGGAKVWQRTLKIDGETYEVGFLLLDVLWDLGAAITLYEAQHFKPHLIVMTGRGGRDAIFEAGALNKAARHPGFQSNGEAVAANTPTTPQVLDPKTKGVQDAIEMTWDNTRLAAAARPVVASMKRGFEVVAPAAARPSNTYICNNIALSVLHGLEHDDIALAGGKIHLTKIASPDTVGGFFHYPAAASNDAKEVSGWARMLATVVVAHFSRDQ